jgi:hypothetical protein
MVEPRSYCFPLSLFIDHCRKQNWKLSQRFAHRLDGEAGRKDKNVIASPGGQDSLALDIYILVHGRHVGRLPFLGDKKSRGSSVFSLAAKIASSSVIMKRSLKKQ